MTDITVIERSGTNLDPVRREMSLHDFFGIHYAHAAAATLLEGLLDSPHANDTPDLAEELMYYLSNDLPPSLDAQELDLAEAIALSADPSEWDGCLDLLRQRHVQILECSGPVGKGLYALAHGKSPANALDFTIATLNLIDALHRDPMATDRIDG